MRNDHAVAWKNWHICEWEETLFLFCYSFLVCFDVVEIYKIFCCLLLRSIAASTENVKEIHVELQSLKQNVEDFRIELPAELQTLVRSVHTIEHPEKLQTR